MDVLRGKWDEGDGTMLVTLRTWNGETVSVRTVVKNLAVGRYGIYVGGALRNVRSVATLDDQVEVEFEVGGKEVDLVVLQARGPGKVRSRAMQ